MPMDPSEFMLTPLSMIDAEYTLWILGVAYVSWLKEDLDYEEFNYPCLMLSLTVEVCALLLILSIPTLLLCSCTW